MMNMPTQRNGRITALVFGILPLVLGLGAAQYLRWSDTVWLSTSGGFWPIVFAIVAIALLIRLLFSDFVDKTSGITAWLILWFAWFYVPLWAMAIEVPAAAAVVSRDGRVHLADQSIRYRESRAWLLTDRPGIRIVHNIAGKVIINALELEYRYADPYIGTRRHLEDLSAPLTRAASAILQNEAQQTRSSKIAMLENGAAQDRVLKTICTTTVGDRISCPLKMKLTPQGEATAMGATWSKYYNEEEALEEKHLPTLVRLLTQADSPIVDRDRVFSLLLELAETGTPLAQVAQSPIFLTDEQFNELIRRILVAPECGDDAIAILSKANRLSTEQRRALRAKALDEATIQRIVAQAVPLRISDAEIAQLAPRMRTAFLIDPGVAVRTLEVFGQRLPAATQRDAVDGIIKAKASYALAALAHVNFSGELRHDLMKKILSDAAGADFSAARLSKESLQTILTPAEMRALIAMAVQRGDTSKEWLELAITLLPIREMTVEERKSLVNGLVFESPRSALEFVSKNRAFLEPAEVNEVTRDYTRSITIDFCLHLSHRNTNWRTNYFSEDQLQIFRDCANAK